MSIEKDVLIAIKKSKGLTLFEAYEEIASATEAEHQMHVDDLILYRQWNKHIDRIEAYYDARMARLNRVYEDLLAKETSQDDQEKQQGQNAHDSAFGGGL